MPTLTQEAILAMEAGPEMDRLVCERILGCKVQAEMHRCGCKGNPHSECVVVPDRHYHEMCPDDLMAPSSDIAAAWEVVARLPLVNRDSACIGFRVHRDEAGAWIAGYANAYPYEGEGWSGLETTAPTAPLAICQAALLTTLEEE